MGVLTGDDEEGRDESVGLGSYRSPFPSQDECCQSDSTQRSKDLGVLDLAQTCCGDYNHIALCTDTFFCRLWPHHRHIKQYPRGTIYNESTRTHPGDILRAAEDIAACTPGADARELV